MPMNESLYATKKGRKKLEKAGLYVRKEDEPTQLGWFLINLNIICYLIRSIIRKLSCKREKCEACRS